MQGESDEKKKEKKRKSPTLQTKEKDKWFSVKVEKPTSTSKPKSIGLEEEINSKTRENEAKSKLSLQKLQDKAKSPEKEAKHKTPEKEIKSKSPEKDIVTSTDAREETDDVISFRTETGRKIYWFHSFIKKFFINFVVNYLDDVLTKELQQEDEKELSPTKIVKTKKTISERAKSRSRSKSPETLNKRVPISFPKRDSTLPKAAIKIRPMLQRKGPSSTVSSVIRKPTKLRGLSYGEEEEEYDPCKPAVGSVASIVRVSERRSSVPPELQANKLLLFKAIEDANKSLTKKPSVRGSGKS